MAVFKLLGDWSFYQQNGDIASYSNTFDYEVSGAFRVEREFLYSLQSGIRTPKYQVSFNASRSSAVYGRSSTVQPNALNMNFIIKF